MVRVMARSNMGRLQSNAKALPAECLWSAAEYAEWRGCSAQAAAHERCRGGGPPFIKLRKRVFYDPVVVRDWFAQHQVNSTAESDR